MSSMNGNSNSLPNTADVVILGAGVMGASIAFQLAQRKAGRIVVIEKDHVGRGGSGRSSALIRMHYSFPPEVQLALISLRMFENWQEVVGQPGDFRKTGFVRIVHPNETERLKHNVEMQRRAGREGRTHRQKQLAELEPDWKVDDVELAAYEPDSGYGDGAGVAKDFLHAARELGVAYFSRTQATALTDASGKDSTEWSPIEERFQRRSWSRRQDHGRGRCFNKLDTIFQSNANITRSQFCEMRRT